ncbi:HERV-H LTR-associating protein 1 [Strigops habroptila]|uniref:HERV-H LTR-associating protein 1 n=1 Tax=Strigops habroptila TaxID=2489341 RepID=UPI0011CFD95E|nr:HERV-H LTR-associating protein 1 [Strigops habroptila]
MAKVLPKGLTLAYLSPSKSSQTCWKSESIMQWFCWHVAAKMSLGFLCLFLVFNTASCVRRENKKEKQVAVLATAELSAKSVDLAAINLTELVNGMLNTTLRGTKKLFSLLSVTSYSSFAFHKVSVTIYNISNVKNVDPGKFPMHYCYCLNNVTNDLTDFTALLVDIIGNSTSYLTEIFKSTSILSVRQSNDSDCIYICVMAGQTGRNLSDFWEMLEKSPVINYTFSSNKSADLDSIFSSVMKLQEDPNKTVDPSAEHVWTFKTTRIPHAQKGEEIATTMFPPWPKTVGVKGLGFPPQHVDASGLLGTARPPLTAGESSTPSPALQPSPNDMDAFWMQTVSPQETNKLMQTEPDLPSAVLPVPPYRPGVSLKLYSATRCSQAILKDSHVTSPPITLLVQKINPCVMELCRFFQLCLCVGQRRYSRKEGMRYCVEYYSWFLRNANYVCARVKRVAYSRTLKQKCLKNICTSV